MRTSSLLFKISVLVAISFCRLAFPDGPPVHWQKTFGGPVDDEGEEVQPTMDGGYIVVGETWSFGPREGNVYLIKTDQIGNTQWERTFGERYWDVGHSVQQTVDGGYIIAGTTNSFSGSAYFDVYLIKTDPNGNSRWQKTFGGPRDDKAYSVQQTTDGGYILAGQTTSFGAGEWDVYLIKTDSTGNLLWERTFGGSKTDISNSVKQTEDGGYILAGTTMSFGAGYFDMYLVKTDPNGNTQWQKTFGGSNWDGGYSARQTSDTGYIITGATSSFGTDRDMYLVKTDPNGEIQWQQTFGGSAQEYGYSVQQTVEGGYAIAGITDSFGAGESDVYLIRTDSSGNLLWQQTFGGNDDDWAEDLHQLADGGYIITGRTQSFGAGERDVYLIKLCSDGILPGDLDCNGATNFEDVSILVSQWLQGRSISFPHADICGPADGIVNFLDLCIVADQWMPEPN